jgi:hypothetical protein
VRKLVLLSLLLAFVSALTGCSSGGAPTAEDDKFQKDLAAANAKDKGKAPAKKAPGVKMEAPPGAASTSAPAAGK